jgi:hypothetical protein
MTPEVSNPFAVLSLIVAPALLTNASSLLAMSTSNRLARAVDRARDLSKQLEAEEDLTSTTAERKLQELAASEQRTAMLVTVLQRFYLAMGGFAAASLISLLGAVLVPIGFTTVIFALESIGVVVACIAVGALVNGSAILVRETRIALSVVQARAAEIQRRASEVRDAKNL